MTERPLVDELVDALERIGKRHPTGTSHGAMTGNIARAALAKVRSLPAVDVEAPGGLVHRLRRYAEIQDADETRIHGRKATNSWAEGFRQAADTIAALSTLSPEIVRERAAKVEKAFRSLERAALRLPGVTMALEDHLDELEEAIRAMPIGEE